MKVCFPGDHGYIYTLCICSMQMDPYVKWIPFLKKPLKHAVDMKISKTRYKRPILSPEAQENFGIHKFLEHPPKECQKGPKMFLTPLKGVSLKRVLKVNGLGGPESRETRGTIRRGSVLHSYYP